jgi:hypothetical protein
MNQMARAQGGDPFGPGGEGDGDEGRPGGQEGGSGGITRGPGPAPLTWKGEKGEEGFEYDPQVLPPTDIGALKESMLKAVSKGAPQAEGGGPSTPGALAGASAGSGSAHTRPVLPRHKGTVRRFFERD